MIQKKKKNQTRRKINSKVPPYRSQRGIPRSSWLDNSVISKHERWPRRGMDTRNENERQINLKSLTKGIQGTPVALDCGAGPLWSYTFYCKNRRKSLKCELPILKHSTEFTQAFVEYAGSPMFSRVSAPLLLLFLWTRITMNRQMHWSRARCSSANFLHTYTWHHWNLCTKNLDSFLLIFVSHESRSVESLPNKRLWHHRMSYIWAGSSREVHISSLDSLTRCAWCSRGFPDVVATRASLTTST